MRRHAIEATAAALGVIWLAAIAVQLCYVADLAGIPWLIGAIVAQIGAFLIASAVMLVTNTRRPWGIDPNAPPVPRERDPFAATTDELRAGVMLGDGNAYGRRTRDDMSVVKRLIGKFEAEDAQRPPPDATPKWALDLQNGQSDIATELFPDPPPDDA